MGDFPLFNEKAREKGSNDVSFHCDTSKNLAANVVPGRFNITASLNQFLCQLV